MIHRALAGSMERFFGVLIEHYGGNFPAWLAPVQAVVAPISEHQLDYAREVAARLEGMGFRVAVDETNEKLGYKIRHWKTQKVPYILVVGKQEAADGRSTSTNAASKRNARLGERICRRTEAKGRHPRMNPSVTLSLYECAFALSPFFSPHVKEVSAAAARRRRAGSIRRSAHPTMPPTTPTPKPSGSPTTPPGNEVTYPVTDAASGIKCPQDQGFSCTVQFAVASIAVAFAIGIGIPVAYTDAITDADADTDADRFTHRSSRRAHAGKRQAHITLHITGLPKDAPKMVNPDPKAVATVALVTLRLRTDADVTLSGK